MDSGKIELIRNGAALDISELSHYAITDYEGFGAPPMRRLSERGPLQHGHTDRGYRLDARILTVALTLRAASWDEIYALRTELLTWLTPAGDTPVILRFTQPSGAVRQIDCHCPEGPSYGRRDALKHLTQRTVFRLTAPDPAWYDPVMHVARAVAGPSGGSGFMFPMMVPWTFGGQDVSAEQAVAYDGTWLEYPEIVISGPISDPKITHLETGETLDFDGTVLEDGESLTIDLRYGRKTIVDQAGANAAGLLTADSDLATWHLRPGQNTVRMEGSGAGAATAITMRYYHRYLGV